MSSKSGIIAGRELIDKIKNAKNGDDSLITCEKWKECKGKECEPDCSYGLDWNNFNRSNPLNMENMFVKLTHS
jgi:hypothetical protein